MTRLFLFALLLAAATPTLSAAPSDVGGAVICDSALRIDRGQAHMFVIREINGKSTPSAIQYSGRDTDVPGARLEIVGAKRALGAGTSTLRLYGTTHHAMPISSLTHESRKVSGDIEFTPVEGEVYRVSGVLGEAYAAVWIENARGEIVSAPVEAFVAGSPQAEAEKQQIAAGEQPQAPETREQAFLGMKEGECAELVAARLGAPSGITEDRSLFTVTPIHEYEGLGKLHFRKSYLGQFVSLVVPTGAISAASVRETLSAAQGETLRQVGPSYYRAGVRDAEVLDLLANEVWRRKDTQDRSTADAMAWFCKTLGQSGNPRYRDVLTAVARDAASGALRRHAKKSLKLLSAELVEQFRPADR